MKVDVQIGFVFEESREKKWVWRHFGRLEALKLIRL